jgi:NAD(P)-dependent dehydrogenase (short-subunit alcohol dehydrogenase family)
MTSPSFDLTGKVALLTGSGRGIGRAIARALAGAGAAVAIQDIDLAAATAAADSVRNAGGRAIALPGDIADLVMLPGLVEQTVRELGGLHLLINNAAIQSHESWLTLTAETAMRQWTANMFAPLRLMQLVYDRFREQKFGRIVNVSSVQSHRGNPHMLSYSMSKAALNNLTSGLGRERDLTQHGITVNAILPGWFDTYRNEGDFPSPEVKIEKGRRVPVGRVGEPEDCAGAVLLLCSQAGEYITGETIVISGGS